MANPKSPAAPNVLKNNAAKDDAIGQDGDFTFTIEDLLKNDPGGANKLAGHFFFGDSATDQGNQAQYLIDHGIQDNGDGSYTLLSTATDFHYFTQIGNNGTWSQALVDVAAPPAPEPHLGGSLFTENFDGYDSSVQQTYQDGGVDVFATVNLASASGWQNTGSDPAKSELGANGYGTIETTSGGFWFDTQNTPGQVNISHDFTDATAAVGGKTSVLSFDAAMQNLDYNGQHYQTDPNASFEFKIDGTTVAHISASDFTVGDNNMQHFDIDISSYTAGGDLHTLTLVDTSANAAFTGFAVDSIAIHDWTI